MAGDRPPRWRPGARVPEKDARAAVAVSIRGRIGLDIGRYGLAEDSLDRVGASGAIGDDATASRAALLYDRTADEYRSSCARSRTAR